jgi:hypothetical protein
VTSPNGASVSRPSGEVDELHLSKNKPVPSSIDGVRSDGSKRAMDLDAKLWTLQRTNGHRVLCGATATLIANSIVEAWIMQTFVQPDVLAEMGPRQLRPLGRHLRPDRRLRARPRRRQLPGHLPAREVPQRPRADRRVPPHRRRAGARRLDLKLPTLTDGRPTVVVVPGTDELGDYVESLVQRAEDIRARKVEPDGDNMFKITGDGRKAALDLRLVDLDPTPGGGKIEAAAQRIARIHRETRHLTYLDDAGQPSPRPGGFQIVFCDLSTPRTDGEWSAYDELRRRLVAHGVPAGEVAFIHDARNDEARARLFARCRSGQIAVLVGSTGKMGVGTNIHTRAVALHHIDCRWRPADIEQREGRVIRQGNQNADVEIVRYATEGSFDVYMWLVDRTIRSTTGVPPATSMVEDTRLARRRSSTASRIRGATIRRCVMCPGSTCPSSALWSPSRTRRCRSGCRSRRMGGPSARPMPTWPIWRARSRGR